LATALGRYFLIAVADAAGSIDETKEKNAKVRPLTVTLPDMIAQSLRVPSSAAAGASVVVSDTTSNKAPVDAGASTTQYYLSADVILDGSDVLLGSRIVPALGAKGRSAGSAPVTIPLATPPGKYFLLAVADGVAEVTEADENNNLRARPITITP
jgi:subtilase family serine protease